MAFAAGGTLILSYTNGTDRWELRVPVAEFDRATFAYTGAGLKAPAESGLADTFGAFGAYWAPYFDPAWALTIEAVFWTGGGEGQRLSSVPTTASIAGTSGTPSSTAPPILRGFTFQLDNGERHVMRLFGIATDTIGARRAVSATSGGFDARDRALIGYLAGPATGLVAWDGQVFPPTAFAYQRYKLRPFEVPGPAGPAGPPGPATSAGAAGDTLTIPDTLGATQPTWTPSCCTDAGSGVPPIDSSGSGGDIIAANTYACGAAIAMANWLEKTYGNVQAWVSSLAATALSYTVKGLTAALISILTAGEGDIALPWLWGPLTFVVSFVVNRILIGGLFPTLDSSMEDAIVQACYQAIGPSTSTITITRSTIDTWSARMLGQSAITAPEPADLLKYIMAFPSTAFWQAIALAGSKQPSALCSGFTVLGNSISGGGWLGPLPARAIQGGAYYTVLSSHAFRGGGYYTVVTARSFHGGASIS